ncbi:MAG: hypothetical protein ACKKL4_00245 [Patescibacteria group bacterium]
MKYHTAFLFFLPAVVFADAITIDQGVIQLINNFINAIINPMIVLLIAAALLLFLWGLLRLMIDLSNGGKGEEGKRHMLWGLVGLIVMISVWGIINLIANSIGAEVSQIDASDNF